MMTDFNFRKNIFLFCFAIFLVFFLLFGILGDELFGPNEHQLVGWQMRPKPILFIHFTKSAGTTVCRLAKMNGEKMMRPTRSPHFSCNLPLDGPSVNKFPSRFPPRFSSCQARAEYLFAQNISFNALEHFLEVSEDPAAIICDREMRYITILREPLERIQSWIVYHQIEPGDVLRWLTGEEDETLYSSKIAYQEKSILYPYVDNYLIRTLCGPDVFRLPLGAVNQTHLNQAWTILQRFEQVILFEELNTELPKLLVSLGWQPSEILHANPSTYQHQYIISNIDSLILKNFNQYDLQLYFLAYHHK